MNKDKHTLPPNNDLSVNKPRNASLAFRLTALGLAISIGTGIGVYSNYTADSTEIGLGIGVVLNDIADITDAPSETLLSSTVQSQLASKAVNLAGNLAE